MIFYKNLKKHKATSEKNLIFSIFKNGVVSGEDDSVGKSALCKTYYNLSYADGALKNGLGFRDLSVPASYDDLNSLHTFNFSEKIDQIKGIWAVRVYNTGYARYNYLIYIMDSSYKLWAIHLIDEYEGFVFGQTTKLSSIPTYQCQYRIANEDSVLFFSEEGMLYRDASSEVMFSNVPALISCVVHYDNFFGITNTNRNTLIYTNNLDLKTWTDDENSTIEFLDNRGSFNKLVAFNDYVYLFREYGITKISLYTSQSKFSFTHLYTSSSKIFENSVCVCGEKVLFMTRDGLYSFSGTSVSKVAENYDKYFKNLDNTNCSSACLNGKYYLATKCNFDDGEVVGCENGDFVNNVLFEIDIETYAMEMYRGVDIQKVLTVDNPYMCKLCASFNGDNNLRIGELTKSGTTFETANAKSWKSYETDLEYKNKRKKIKEIVLTTLHPISVQIDSDEESKIFEFSGSEKEQRMPVSVVGKTFQFTFATNEQNCCVKKPMIVFDVVE